MTVVQLFLLAVSVMTHLTESKSLGQAKKKSTCGIRRLEAFDMMLTCYFHDNISALQKDFTVYLYEKEQQSPKAVLSCQWIPLIFCHVAPGYEYENDINVHHDHTNLRIPHAAKMHAGTYTCQVMGESEPGTCSLTEEQIEQNSLSSNLNTKLTSTTLPAQTTATTSVHPDDRQKQRGDEQSSATSELSVVKDVLITEVPEGSLAEELQQTSSQANTVILVALPSLFGFIIVIIIVVVIRRCRRSRIDAPMEQEETSPVPESALITGDVNVRAVFL